MITVEGKTEYFDIIYQRYFQKVMDKCHSLLRDKSMAKEFANEIFGKVFEKLSGFKGTASFSSWLYSITYNYCIEYLRLKKKLHYPEWNRENELPEIVDDPEESLAEIDYDKLMVVMDMIHPEEKALLLMKYQVV